MAKKQNKSVGSKMVDRLKRFTDTLATTKDTKELSERFTCRTLKLNLEPQPYSPDAVKEARRILNVSQAIFAQFIGVSLSTVRDWEQGLKPPGGAACRMMDEIKRNPDYFLQRLRELSETAVTA